MEEVLNVEGALQPCDICGRTFLPAPLTKHMRVCERNATRKRKVFDSLKQRVEGTELAQFHQRTYLKRQQPAPIIAPEVNKRSSKWKEKHLELVNTIRAARGLPLEMPTSPRRTPSNSAAGSERCPSCDRQFGPRAFDRHVEWCKEHRARVHRSPAEVLLAKERLEARTKYRVPPPKSKRTLVRDKYSPTLGNRTESVNSVKSISCSNLERNPSIRKQKSHINSRTERELVKLDVHNEPITEMKYEEHIPKLQIKEKYVPKERKIPVIEGQKSSHLPRLLPRSKINTTEINESVEGITVSHMKMCSGDIRESIKMVTWKDTLSSPTLPSLNLSVPIRSNVNNRKANQNRNAKKIVDAGIQTVNLNNNSKTLDSTSSTKNINETVKIKKNTPKRKCSKIQLTMDVDNCSLGSSTNINETFEHDLKHTTKKISFKRLNDVKDNNFTQNVIKTSLPNLKSEMQQNKQIASELEEDESENVMTAQLKVPFSIAKYHKSKIASDIKLKAIESKFQLPLDRKCHTINEFDEEELNTENEEIVSEAAISEEYVWKTPSTIKNQKDFSVDKRIFLSPINTTKEVFSNRSQDSLEIIDESPTVTVREPSIIFDRIEEQQDNDIIPDNYLLENSNEMKMYDSYKLKNSDILTTVQDICSKEKHCANTELNIPRNTNNYLESDTSKIDYDFKDNPGSSKTQNEFLEENEVDEQSVTSPMGDNITSNAYESKPVGLGGLGLRSGTRVKKDRWESLPFNTDISLEEGCSGKRNAGLGTNEDKLLLCGYNKNISEDTPIQSYDDIVIPTIAKAVPFRLNFENQGTNSKNIDVADESANRSLNFIDLNSNATSLVSSDNTNTHTVDNNRILINEDEENGKTSLIASPTFSEYHHSSTSRTNKISEAHYNFDFDSLENITEACKDENEKFDNSFPKYIKNDTKENISESDISVLHEPSCDIAEIDSLECVDVNIWNEALSIARMERTRRKCCSAVCLNTHKSEEHNFSTFTELDLSKFMDDDDFIKGRCIHFQYQTDDAIIEGNHIELQCEQTNEWSSDKILEVAGEQFLTSFRGDGDCLTSIRSTDSSLECIPAKRRKLCDDTGDFVTSTSSSSDCSTIGNTVNNIIFKHNLTKNLEKIKSIKNKLEQEVGGGEIMIPYEESDNSEIQNNSTKYFQFGSENEIYPKSNDLDIHNNKCYSKQMEQNLLKNGQEEQAMNCPVGTLLKRNKNNYDLETNNKFVFENISPRFLDLIESIIADDNSHVKDSDNDTEDMLVVSKKQCKILLELDPHVLDISSKIKLPQIQLQRVKTPYCKQKLINDDVENTNFTLPPIKMNNGGTSKIPVTKQRRESGSSLCIKEPVTLPKLVDPSSDAQSDYNPFVTAERQLMELLECDDFKPFFRDKSSSTQHLQRPHTTTNTKSKLTDIHKNNKIVKSAENARKSDSIKLGSNTKRASVIDPPMDFQDNLLSDDFEMIERLINQNYADGYDINNDLKIINFDSITNKIAKTYVLNSEANENNNSGFTTKERKYSDDMSSIDPRLINENDNLSIPENLKIDDNSSNSSNDVIPLISNLHKEKYDSKRVVPKITSTEKNNRSLNRHNSVLAVKKSKQINDDKKFIKPIKQTTKGTYKSTTSLTSSYGSTRNNINTDKKKNLSTLKRSVSLVDPVKPKNLKNKQDVENYFDEQDRKNAIKAERTSPEHQLVHRASPERQIKNKSEINTNISNTPTAEELFSVDDEMYEEYKKYEEMYLREKQQHMQSEKKPDDFVSSGTLTPNEGSEIVPSNVKVSADSAYSSLNRKTPKVRARSTKLAPLDCQASHSSPGSPHSSGSEDVSPTIIKRSIGSQRMSKFCHECGNKYPINTAKFCVECGVRRLVL